MECILADDVCDGELAAELKDSVDSDKVCSITGTSSSERLPFTSSSLSNAITFTNRTTGETVMVQKNIWSNSSVQFDLGAYNPFLSAKPSLSPQATERAKINDELQRAEREVPRVDISCACFPAVKIEKDALLSYCVEQTHSALASTFTDHSSEKPASFNSCFSFFGSDGNSPNVKPHVLAVMKKAVERSSKMIFPDPSEQPTADEHGVSTLCDVVTRLQPQSLGNVSKQESDGFGNDSAQSLSTKGTANASYDISSSSDTDTSDDSYEFFSAEEFSE